MPVRSNNRAAAAHLLDDYFFKHTHTPTQAAAVATRASERSELAKEMTASGEEGFNRKRREIYKSLSLRLKKHLQQSLLAHKTLA